MKRNPIIPSSLLGLFLCLFAFSADASRWSEPSDTIRNLVHQRNRIAVLKVNNRVSYRMQKVPVDSIVFSTEESGIDSGVGLDRGGITRAFAPAGNYYPTSEDCQGAVFAGKDRALVKTHTVSGHLVSFSNLNDLFASGLLIPDETMRNGESGVKKDPEGERVDVEKKTVLIKQAFLYGIYRESDNDFHIIIGNGLAGSKRKLFNIEISGLPGDAPNSTLKTPRKKIIARFGDIRCNDGAFKPIDKLIPIRIKGALFYDIDHPPGHVGFGNYKPKTAWEIHPVQQIIFLDE